MQEIVRKSYKADASDVFDKLLAICNKSRLSVKMVERSIRRVVLSTPPSLFSWGENIEVIVQSEGGKDSLVYIKAQPKLAVNITAGSAIDRDIKAIINHLDSNFSE